MRLSILIASLVCASLLSCDRSSTDGQDGAVDQSLVLDAGVPDQTTAPADDLAPPDDLSSPDLVLADDGGGAQLGAPCGQSAHGEPCQAGLACCYPCGHPGCEYLCQTPCHGGGCVNGCLLIP